MVACPCGGQPELIEENTDMNLSLKGVRCKKCGEAIPLLHDHAPEAIRAWNDWAGGRKPAMSKTAGVKALASATGSATPVEWWLKRAAELAQQMKVGGVQTLTLNRLPTGKYEFEITPEG